MFSKWHGAVMRLIIGGILVALIAGCATTRQAVLTTTFDPAAAAFINQTGSAKISGQAFVRKNNGKLLRAVGTDIFLIPSTPYSDERIKAIYGNGKQQRWDGSSPEDNPLYEQYMRKTIASSGGSFSFDHVANGDYYVIAMIHLPSNFTYMEFPILHRASVRDGKSVRLVMRGY